MPPAESLLIDHAQIVTADDCFLGQLAVDHGVIQEVNPGESRGGNIDFEGDYLLPGLVELHTDHVETHYMPRPGVLWPVNGAIFAYDAQIAASGITSVFDSFRIGTDIFETRGAFGEGAEPLVSAMAKAQAAGMLRAKHFTHMRCEVPAADVVDMLERFLTVHPTQLISLMDHSPGQRQFRDLDKYFAYYTGKDGGDLGSVKALAHERQRLAAERTTVNRPRLLAMAKARGIALASHDDTTLADVQMAKSDGIVIAEFPTTLEAAQALRQAGIAVVMGAPNVVRGGSHSGNVSALALAQEGVLDILSSDYVPSALLAAAFQLADVKKIGGLPGAINLVAKRPAQSAGLHDRGVIAKGLKGDFLRVKLFEGFPVVRGVWRSGQQVA